MAETSFRDGFEVPFRDYVLKDVELATLVEGRFYPLSMKKLEVCLILPSYRNLTWSYRHIPM